MSMLISILFNKDLQTWHLIGWQPTCQPTWSHVRKPLLTNMNFFCNRGPSEILTLWWHSLWELWSSHHGILVHLSMSMLIRVTNFTIWVGFVCIVILHVDKFMCDKQSTFTIRMLTRWGRVTHICVRKLTIIGSDNGLPPGRRQAIIWTNARILLIGPLGTNFSELLIEIHTFSFKKMHLKISSAKWRPCCLGLNVLMVEDLAMKLIWWSQQHVSILWVLLCYECQLERLGNLCSYWLENNHNYRKTVAPNPKV